MSDQLLNYLNLIKHKFNKINLVGIYKKKFLLQDGIIKFFIKKSDFSCPLCPKKNVCDLKKCHHVYFILIEHYKLNINDLSLLWLDDNYKKLVKGKDLNKDLTKEECHICLDSIGYNDGTFNYKKIFQCLNCSKFFHKKCLNEYKKNNCILCYSII